MGQEVCVLPGAGGVTMGAGVWVGGIGLDLDNAIRAVESGAAMVVRAGRCGFSALLKKSS